MESLIFGHSAGFWLELLRLHENKEDIDFIEEIAMLRAKVSFYESRITAMNDFMVKRLEIKTTVL